MPYKDKQKRNNYNKLYLRKYNKDYIYGIRQRTEKKECKRCGKLYAPLNKTQKFCSGKCRIKNREYNYNYNKEYQRNYREYNKEYQRNYNMIKRYGITFKEYQKILKKQKGLCSLCGSKQKQKNKYNKYYKLHIDHDHKNGKVRGLLCNNCNCALGFIKDNINTLKKMIKYLKRSS